MLEEIRSGGAPRHGSAVPNVAIVGSMLAGLAITSFYSYLLFHALVELSTVAVAWSVFFLAWNARKWLDSHSLLLIGIGALFVGGIDLFHALAYKGMGVFPGDDANLPTKLWIAGRYVQALTFLAAPFFVRRPLHAGAAFAVYTALCAGLGISLYSGVFPDCYVEGAGLTPFKIVSEWVIIGVLLLSLWLLLKSRAAFDATVFRELAAAVLVSVVSEVAFTLYVDVYGAANVAGHLLRFLATAFIYRAIVVTGFVRPYDLLFRNLARSEDALRHANEKLEGTVAELQHALAEVKTLKGLLPMCANCKKIRDDRGYWQQVENYIGERSGVSFSHGICPECLVSLYPDYYAPVADEKAQSGERRP